MHQTLSLVPEASRQRLVRCWVDGEACTVGALEEEIELAEDARGRVQRIHPALPCDRCRFVDHAAEQLEGVRLGRVEREVLLSAPPWGGRGVVIDPDMPRAPREAARRAVRKLVRVGLGLASTRRHYGRLRQVWRSPLGEAVVELYRAELESGGRIRWDVRLVEAGRRARAADEDLVAEWRRAVEDGRRWRAWSGGA